MLRTLRRVMTILWWVWRLHEVCQDVGDRRLRGRSRVWCEGVRESQGDVCRKVGVIERNTRRLYGPRRDGVSEPSVTDLP